MPFGLATGARCFIDANVLYYCFTDVPPFSEPCRELLQRVERQEVTASITAQVLSDVVHKTMLSEIAVRFSQPRAGLVGWLKKHPEALAELQWTRDVVRRLMALPLSYLTADSSLIADAMDASAKYHLLMNDAMIVAAMKRQGLSDLVTNDDDFGRVSGLTVWKPR